MRGNISAFEFGRIKIVEIIDNTDAPDAFAEKMFNKVRTDETRAAGNENIFLIIHRLFWGVNGIFQSKQNSTIKKNLAKISGLKTLLRVKAVN
jgi:hypothetical protein